MHCGIFSQTMVPPVWGRRDSMGGAFMRFDLLHPADQLVMIMQRIYEYGMTTTSGGNLSIRDTNGDVWITPSGIDKGSLTRADICCVKPDGTILGPHKRRSSFRSIWIFTASAPDLNAILHAHPPTLVAFSVAAAFRRPTLCPTFPRCVAKSPWPNMTCPAAKSWDRTSPNALPRAITPS